MIYYVAYKSGETYHMSKYKDMTRALAELLILIQRGYNQIYFERKIDV